MTSQTGARVGLGAERAETEKGSPEQPSFAASPARGQPWLQEGSRITELLESV